MTIEDLQYFNTKEGRSWLEKYKHLSDDELEMLAFSLVKQNVPHYPYLITLLKLRKKAKGKFSLADKMFFDSLSLEMATSEKIGRHIAERFKKMAKIGDLTCGIGGNAIFLAKNSKVLAVDLEKTNIEMARLNARAYGVEKNMDFIVGNAFFHIEKDIDAFFLDPMRTREGKSKTRSIFNTMPRLNEILPRIFEVTKNVCVKISPAFDYKEVLNLVEKPEIELISENNENRVALLWFGDFKRQERKASLFVCDKKIQIVNANELEEIEIIEKPLEYIYEPNKAIIKAHLIDEMASEFGLVKINKNIAFLTKNSLISEGKDKFRIFRISEYKPFSIKELKKDLKKLNKERISVINRGTPIFPEKLIKDLGLKDGNEIFVLLTKLKNDKNYYILSEMIK